MAALLSFLAFKKKETLQGHLLSLIFFWSFYTKKIKISQSCFLQKVSTHLS